MTVADIERIGAPQITRQDARKAFLEYRHAVNVENDGLRKSEYQALMHGYKAIAAGQSVIDLHHVLSVSGLQHDTLYPRLAICNASARRCVVDMEPNGSASFHAESRDTRGKRTCVRVPAGTFQIFTWGKLPDGNMGYRNRPNDWKRHASAVVPLVPAALRPRASLTNYDILWDAVWSPEPPRDPLLLRHLAGALYAVVAHWDLSPLERAVLRGRI